MGLTISNAFGSAVSDYGVQIISNIPTPSKSMTRSLQAKSSRRLRKGLKRRLRRLLRRRDAPAAWRARPHRSNCPEVCGLNQDPLNLRKDLRVGSFNTRTLKASWRLEEACFLACKRKIDILCVQEHRIRVPASDETTPYQRSLEGGYSVTPARFRNSVIAHGETQFACVSAYCLATAYPSS